MKSIDPPEIFHSLGRKEGGVMLELPFYSDTTLASNYLVYQIFHRQKVLDGRIARHLELQWKYFRSIPIAKSFLQISRFGKVYEPMINHDPAMAPMFRSFFQLNYLTLYPPFSTDAEILRYVRAVFPDAELLADQKGVQVYKLPPVTMKSFELRKTDPRIFLFLLENWEVDSSDDPHEIVCRQNQALLLTPEVKPNETLKLQMNLKSSHGAVIKSARASLSVGDRILGEITLRRHPQNLRVEIPGTWLVDARRIVKIQLVYPAEKKPKDTRPKLELSSIRMNIEPSRLPGRQTRG